MRKITVGGIKAILILLLLTSNIYPGENMADKTNPELNDLSAVVDGLSWLAGRWEGEAFGGKCEEIWSPPTAGSMVGVFTVWKEDKVSFYEIETIAVDSSGLFLNVKHFNADLTGWEEKDEVERFPFESAGEKEINFNGITYRMLSPDSLQILIDLKNKEGETEKVEISCRKIS